MIKYIIRLGIPIFVFTSICLAQWETPENLGADINSSSDEFGPTISSDGNTLYFSSDRPGGLGDYDIWVSIQNGSVWSQPTNVGSPVNTDYTDFLPSVSTGGDTLYFISNRPVSQNLDIWMSWKVGNDWQNPVNLGPTVNSAGDE